MFDAPATKPADSPTPFGLSLSKPCGDDRAPALRQGERDRECPAIASDASEPVPDGALLWAWRHPRAEGAQGRCIGRTDLRVDPRRAKRLAHRIRQAARRHGLPRLVWTSPLRRCADVGRWLRRWGWEHRIDAALMEADFGAWDGLGWERIPREEIDAWCADFATARPGGGESLRQVLARAAAWTPPAAAPALLVTHGGWMLARRWVSMHAQPPKQPGEWPRAPGHGCLWRLGMAAAGWHG